jgi:drug/metabolite transporter (DMT)-like permease
MNSRPETPLASGLGLSLTGAVIWASAFATAKFGLVDCPPLLYLVVRFLASGAILLAWAAVRGARTHPREVAMLAAIGLLNFGAYLGFANVALLAVPSAIVAAVIGVNPVAATGFGALLLGERITWRVALSLALGALGVGLVTLPRALAGPAGDWWGYPAVVASLLLFALGTVLFRRHGARAEPLIANGVQTAASGLALIPVSLAFERWDALRLTVPFLLSQAWLVLVVTIAGYLIWFRLLRTGTVAAAAAVQFLLPPLGLAYGAVLHGETLTATDLIGVVPILAALALARRRGG